MNSCNLGIGGIFPGPYFSWHLLPTTKTNTQKEIEDIKKYMAENGPFDGAMGFSQGAMMIMALMLEHQFLNPFEPALFQVAIFFCGGLVPELKQLVDNGLKIKVPTAHILGGKKDSMYEESLRMRDACDKHLRSEYEHNEGHCIPRKSNQVIAMTKIIKRTVDRAIYNN